MRKLVSLLVLFAVMPCFADARIDAAIENVRATCGGISDELSDMKKMAGINTAVTSVATVAGGVALGTGIAKTGVDKEVDATKAEMENLMKEAGFVKLKSEDELLDVLGGMFAQTGTEVGKLIADSVEVRRREIEKLEKQSKNLGDWRTGTMATAAAANIAGAVVVGTNKVKGDLKSRINQCIEMTKILADARMQAHVSKSADESELSRAERIVMACQEWGTVADIDSINNKSQGAMISSGVGAGLGVAGTVASAMANSDSVRDDNSESGKKKEKNLNTASNILAGGTTVASGVATIFNATQIKVIKRAASIAEACEGALRE